ncbi:uncharacterized protein LOC111314717 [Durio zibethinus]|uniref:Uncharacterized protein LOC111314717 n=1 Tax=Durio zibethinus TaxID=66656 RepID=A0A6P6B4J1_DURZI|nr:uncharacterized protein LOC111314717 [Durio zibethinus]
MSVVREMNEQTEKTASALAITEKKPHRTGGCVGIFFQLFDWNRRIAKKKLFSRKLLPPARSKASKKFGGDEKMPKSKLHLIADENKGGFPNVKKNIKHSNGETEQKHEMRAPGLVARLMGLESLPAVKRDKSNKKALVSGSNSDVRDGKMLNSQSGANGEALALEKSGVKIEASPQKLQKIKPYDRRVVPRFGAEALQIKGVLSLSKKHHHQKFVSPVKCPRISSARNASRASRLIDAAAKILEPGLHATNRAKYALAYSSSMHYSSKNEDVTKGIGVLSPDVLKQSGCNVITGKSPMGQMSCKNCGNLLDEEYRAKLEEQQFIYPAFAPNFIDAFSQGLEKNWPRSSPSTFSQGKEVIFERGNDQPLSSTGQEESNVQSSNVSDAFRKPLSGEAQARWHLTSQLGKPPKNEKSPISFKPKTQTQNHILLDRDRIPARAKLNKLQSRRAASAANAVSGAKDFVALNRSLTSCTRHRVPIKVDSCPIDIQRKSCSHQDDSLSQLRSPVRKRRRIRVNGQAESAGFINSTIGKERTAKCNPVTRRDMVHAACTVDRICVKSRSTSQETGNGAKDKNDTDIISFTFNSPLKQKHVISRELKDEGKDQIDINCRNDSLQRSEILEDNYGETSVQKNLPLAGDALNVLLEQKLKELTSQEEYELKTGCTLPKRTTAMILQELISALTSEQPNSQNGHLFNSDTVFQTDAKAEGTAAVGFVSHGDNFSPGSVLEASFSNDSCVSSSLDGSLGLRLHLDSMDSLYDEPQQTEPDKDLLDSAASLDRETFGNEMITDLVNRISVMLPVISNFGLGLSGDKLIHVKEAIMKAELLFGNVIPHDSDETDDFLLEPYVHYEIETLAGAMWIDFNSLLGVEQTKENNQLRGFLFDCAIECLDSKYGRYCNSGFEAWKSLPFYMNSRKLIQDVANEVRMWTRLAGMVPDELIEWEMSYSLGKWTDFDIEAYETVAEMDWDILRNLVEEIVVDLVPP